MPLVSEQKRASGASVPGDVEDSYPLTPLQQGMLFHTLYESEGGVEIEQFLFTILADLNTQAFNNAWQQVIDRHPILRTSFRWQGLEQPLQLVHNRACLSVHHEDWRTFPFPEQQERLDGYLKSDRLRGFDLTRAPLMRVGLLQIADRGFHLVYTFHHALLDGRSLLRVLEEVHALYDSALRGLPLRVPAPRPFREHIEALGQVDIRNAELFWRETLRGFTKPTPLPASWVRRTSPEKEPAHDELGTRLSKELTSSLKTLAAENGVTLYTLVEASWALLLSCYCGERDVVFGAIRACRSSSDNDSLGLFINTVPLRVNVPEDKPLKSWLKELRAQHLALREYERTPLAQIQEWSEVSNGEPLFETFLEFKNYDLRSFIQSLWSNWEIRDFKLLEQTNYPLSLSGSASDTLLLKIEYQRQRFEKDTIERMLGHLTTILQEMVPGINEPVSRIAMLTAAERHQIVIEWNNNTSTNTERRTVHKLFEEQAARTPNAVAVISEDARVSYSELNARANQLAHYLISRGVGPETLVGISVKRSLEMIVGVLGILKAGGAYVPLDCAYPDERLAVMLADARVPVLLTQQHLRARLPKTDVSLVCLDSDWEIVARHSTDNPTRPIAPENLAYVVYTSGSTGTPKGVLIEHRSLSSYVAFAGRDFRITPDDRILQFASLSFDTSAEEIFPSLARGATVVLRTDAMLNSIPGFLRKCSDWNITVLDLPTAYWHELTASLLAEGLSLPKSIRLVIIGGERALPERVAEWRRCAPTRVRLLNTYGPTEATIVATIADLSEPLDEVISDVPVGRPISDASIYILDRHLNPTPIGVSGELYIGGTGLARGYLNRPELTAEKFLADPFKAEAGRRLYRTGDRARYSPDGIIQISGRVDNQVKINGFRVELGDIENALRSSAQVNDAVVMLREDRSGVRRLVAYVVPPRSAYSFAPDELRDQLRGFLKKKLPTYMLPSWFVLLDELPLSNSGKVDRSRLPMPDPEQTASKKESYVRPRDPLERQLVEIWEDVLGVRPIGIKDNFFDLGGHSLLSVRMMSRIEQITGRRLPLATLFDEATVEHLAAMIIHHETSRSKSAIVKIGEGGTKRPFFFLHGDFNGGGFFCRKLAHGLGDERPFYAIQPHGLDGSPIPLTIEAMALSHLHALREVQPRGPYLLGGYCNGAAVAFEIARQLQAEGEKIDLLVLLCSSVTGALRYKLLYNLVNRSAGGVSDAGSEERLRRFLEYRARLIRVLEIKDYYKARFEEFSRLQIREQVSFVKGKTRTTLKNLGRALASIQKHPNRQAAPFASSTQEIGGDRRQLTTAAYARAIMGYVPRPYYGPVTVLWPSELALEDPKDPTAGWSRVTTSVDVQTIPGGHITCVTNYVDQLAMTLRKCIDESQTAEAGISTRAARA